MRNELTRLKADSFPVVSLFLKWYLCRETLGKNRKIKTLLEEMDEGMVADQMKWAGMLRLRISGEGLRALRDLLERPLSQSEILHLFERIEEFIQLYSTGLKT